MKGLILAGGTGSRMFPITQGINKHLLPVFDKPMIYYPLSVLMLADIKEIGIVCSEECLPQFRKLLRDGSQFGLQLTYIIQEKACGISDAIKKSKEFLGNNSFCMILGDNFFFGPGLTQKLLDAKRKQKTATIFAYEVDNPQHFGVITYNNKKEITSVEEKPSNPLSNHVATGLYMFDNHAVNFIDKLQSSSRGELEVTDLLNLYIEHSKLDVEVLGRGYAWLDMGTSKSLMDASVYIQAIEHRQGFKIACLEEIAFLKSWISHSTVVEAANNYQGSGYGEYLSKLLQRQL